MLPMCISYIETIVHRIIKNKGIRKIPDNYDLILNQNSNLKVEQIRNDNKTWPGKQDRDNIVVTWTTDQEYIAITNVFASNISVYVQKVQNDNGQNHGRIKIN